ncbi:MAG TPA: hypothetical protein VLD65_08190, partial [Anaerolineales bacterium]|nr:hypothetical protein [Anaerolineales bacterium]
MSDFITALIGARVPTLLIIGGLIFLFIGIATIKKPIVIVVTPSSRKIALVLGVVLVGAGLYLLSQSNSEQKANMPTEIPLVSTMETSALVNVVAVTEPPSLLAVYSSPDIVHLGDENVAGWAKLTDV